MFLNAHQNCDGDLLLCDTTGFGEQGFVREDEIDDTRYKLSQVGIYTVLKYHSSKETLIVYTDFKTFESEEIIKYKHVYNNIVVKQNIPITVDGYYTLQYFAIPKEITYEMQYNYYCDLEGNIFTQDGIEIELDDINFCYSNILYHSNKFFFYNNLRSVFLKYTYNKIYANKEGILNRIRKACCDDKSGMGSSEINKDVVGSALAAIRYLIELCRYEDAQIIIEQLSGCGDIYSNNQKFANKNYGCGCG